jgi:hypothetical protein
VGFEDRFQAVSAESAQRHRQEAGGRSESGGKGGVHAAPINLEKLKSKIRISKIPC